MANFYEVNPTDTTQIFGPYVTGQVNVRLNNGREISRVNGPVPEWDFYATQMDARQCDDNGNPSPSAPASLWYVREVNRTFQGTVQTPTGLVIEAVACTQKPIDEVLRIKTEQVGSRRQDALIQGISVTLSQSGTVWMQSDSNAWVDTDSIHTQTGLPGVTDFTLWDIYVHPIIFRKGDMDTYALALALHRLTVNANAATHVNAMNDLHAANNWRGLVDYDVTTGWPDPPPAERPTP